MKKISIILLVILTMSCGKQVNISITTESNSEIIINNKNYTLPIEESFKVGSALNITINKEGYLTRNEYIYVKEKDNDYTFPLEKDKVKLNIESNIKNVKYYLGEKEVSFPLILKRNTYTIFAKAPGYKDKKISTKLENDKTIELTMTPITVMFIKTEKAPIYDESNNLVNELKYSTKLEVINESSNLYTVKLNNKICYINPKHLSEPTIITPEYYLGIMYYEGDTFEHWNNKFVKSYYKIYLYNKNTDLFTERAYFNDTDKLEIKKSNGYIDVIGNYNNFGIPSAPMGYEYIFRYKTEEINLNNPEFYYFKEIGGQDWPYFQLSNIDYSDKKINLVYKYYENSGFSGYGSGTFKINYINNGTNYELTSYEFDGKLDENSYKTSNPFIGSKISKKYDGFYGEGWTKNNDKYHFDIKHLNSKFLFLLRDSSILYNNI